LFIYVVVGLTIFYTNHVTHHELLFITLTNNSLSLNQPEKEINKHFNLSLNFLTHTQY